MSGDTVVITPATGGNVVRLDDEIGVTREPIIAWRHIVSPHDQTVTTWPITVEGTHYLSDGEFAVETPDPGATFPFTVPHDAAFQTIEQLVEFWRGRAGQ